MSNPTVSVLTTAYNREAYIAEAIESVLASTFQDFELIVVDDCSKDGTLEIARQYSSDPRVRVYANDQNLGDYPNRNRAAALAQGKYLKYLDSDDVLYPHGLGIMVEAMERFPEVALGICRPASSLSPYPILVEPKRAYYEHFLGDGLFSAGPSGCIIRSDAFRSLQGFSGMRFAGDTEMWLRLAAQYSVVKMVDNLVWWRSHPGQEYRQGHASLAYSFLNFRVAMEALTHRLCPLVDDDREKAIRQVKYEQARLIWRLALRERRLRAARDLYRDSGLTRGELRQGLRRRKN